MSTRFRTLIATAALCLGAFGSASALADQTIAAGSLTADYASGSSPISAGFFTDTWTFSLPTASTVSGAVFNIATSPAKLIGSFSAQFLDSLAAPVATFLPATTALPGGMTLQSLSTPGLSLGAGSYSLVVTGVAGSGGPALSVNIAVSPVPEADAWAMLLAGLTLVGTVVVRRRA